MQESLFELYSRCFPDNIRPEKTVRRVLALPGNDYLTEERDGRLIGAAVLFENTVLLLGVLPEYRRQGIGSALLEKCEAQARERGFSQLQFCDGPEYITPGIPMVDGNEKFFQKRGYVHDWGDCECVDLSLNMADFTDDGHIIGDTVNGVAYRWAESGDRPAAVECVETAYPDFTAYYRPEALYDGKGPERVLTAWCDGKVCGTLLVSAGTERPGVGSVGCTVTREEYQRRGIATNMVRLGTGYLKSLGLEKSFIGYTYTDIVHMYGRSGYRVCRTYFMGKKKLG